MNQAHTGLLPRRHGESEPQGRLVPLVPHADHDAVPLRVVRTPSGHDHRTVGVCGDLQAHRAEQQTGEATTPAGADHDQVGILGLAQDGLGRTRMSEEGLDRQARMGGPHPGTAVVQHAGGHLENLPGEARPGLVVADLGSGTHGMDEFQGTTAQLRLARRPVHGEPGVGRVVDPGQDRAIATAHRVPASLVTGGVP